MPNGILGFDKFQHLLAYFVLSAALGLWVSREFWQKRRFRAVIIMMSIASVYGIIDEIHQYFVPGRNCNVWDWLADTIGAVLGAIAFLLAARVMARGAQKTSGGVLPG
jgi:VanZ family protein